MLWLFLAAKGQLPALPCAFGPAAGRLARCLLRKAFIFGGCFLYVRADQSLGQPGIVVPHFVPCPSSSVLCTSWEKGPPGWIHLK